MEKLTYKDFKIGQLVTCVKRDDFYEDHLSVGKQYKIVDLDFHFWDKLCVKSDNKITSMFMPIDFFSGINIIRKLKLEKLNKIDKK